MADKIGGRMRSVVIGLIAAGALLALPAILMPSQLRALWWLMVPLAGGFGVQVGLYFRLRQRRKAMLAAGGASAGTGMLACCAHHLVDVLPIIGLSAVSSLLAVYQVPILIISLIINTWGIYALWRQNNLIAG